jgi:tetratricopeptide (TPR) repeat protein
MVMLSNGRIMGPYSTDAVLKLIGEGALTGTEKIKKATGGSWIPISKEPDFYDRLLEALHAETPKVENPTLPETMAQETVVAPLPIEAMIPPTDPDLQPAAPMQGNFEETAILHQPQTPAILERSQTSRDLEMSPLAARKSGHQVVDLQNLGTMAQAHQLRKLKVPLVFLSLAVALGLSAYFFTGDNPEEKIQLLVPKYGPSATLTSEELKAEVQKTVRVFQYDTFETYYETQSLLVSILERAPNSLDARGFLCLTYRELWPHTKQDSSDIEAVNSIVKTTKALDPVGAAGSYCEISKLLMFGKVADARGILDYLLNQRQFSTDPVLISLKAEVLSSEQDPKSAALFSETVRQLWPTWVKAAVQQAEYLMQSGQTQQAAAAYERVLKMNPKHKAAQIQYGILNYRFFKQSEIALNYLTGALSSNGRVLRQLEAKANFVLAQIWSEQRQPAKARDYAQRAYDLNPGDSEYKEILVKLGGTTELSKKNYKHNELVFLGDQYLRAGDCLSAQAEYKAAFELDTSNALAATKAAKCLWQLNQSSEAINWLAKAIKADPRLTEAYTMMSDYYSQRYNYQSALQTLNRAAMLFPNNNDVLRGYGQLEFRRNNMKDAIGYLQRALKAYENDVETILLLAKAHAALGEYQMAQNYAIRAMELDSTNNDAIVVYAKNLVQFRGLDAGLYYIKDQISKFSYTIEFRLALAEMYRDVERYRDAQTVYEQVLEADPKNKKAFMGLGESLQAIGAFDKALRAYLNAAVQDPSDAEPLFKAGQLYIDMNRFTDAKTQFERALKVNPFYPRGNYYVGKAAFLNMDYQTALKFCQAERQINPNLADSYILAAEVYSAVKDFAKCAGEYQLAVRLRPQGAEIYVKMARCYRQAGSPDIAENMLNIAVTQESGLPDIYKEQGAIYEGRGDARSAVRAYDKYLALSPNAPDRAELEARINSLNR